MGDSNTNHIYFAHEKQRSNHIGSIYGRRIRAFTIEEICPTDCIGFQNIVLQVGLNNLKNKFAVNGTVDVCGTFDSWLHKVISIRQMCPYSRIIVAPVPPTQIRGLNDRAKQFNALLFGCKNKFWVELGFNHFLDPDTGLLDNGFGRIFQVTTGRKDRIHLGRLGIARLSFMIKESVL